MGHAADPRPVLARFAHVREAAAAKYGADSQAVTFLQYEELISVRAMLTAVPDAVLLRRPNLTQTTRSPKPGSKQLVVSDAALVGHYTVAPAGGGPALAGFSINPPAGESDFTRLKNDQLDEMFGKDCYQVARNIDELKSDVKLADLGKEVFSVLMVLVIAVFVGEHLVANRFYESEQDEERGQDSGFRIQGNVPRASERSERVKKAELSAR